MAKFNRSYNMLIDTNDGGQLQIELPLTVGFNIVRNTLSSANTAIFRIYNLSETNRSRISKDRWDYDLFKKINFFAGYGGDIPACFSGNVQRCYSTREGVDIVTTIEAFDAGHAFTNAQLENAQYVKGTSRKAIVKDMIGKLQPFGVEEGQIGVINGTIVRGNSYTGSVTKNLNEITGGKFFIDNGKAHVLGESETIRGAIRVINSANGLLSTPIKENGNLDMSIIFEPRLIVGQRIAIDSVVNKEINQNYKVVSVSHQGMVSEAIAGSATTKIGCIITGNLYEV